ncbi:MAG: splicing factor [Bogoriella megaspora]|nr:MAG: splicing factor [Bogoriella megaspora]
MAAEQQQLMGDQYNAGPGLAPATKLSITDPKLCRSYLVGTCPHDLFINTKQDIGPCLKTHSEALKTEYQEASDEQKKRWGFEFDYLRDMQKHVEGCDRRIENLQGRLEKNPEEIRKTYELIREIRDATDNIDLGNQEMLWMADMGEVQMAVEHHWFLQRYHQKKAELERQLKELNDTSGPSGHQKLQVCDVCGAYLSRLDNDRRLADHFYGKMHLGYSQMRKTYKALQEELKGRAPPPKEPEAPAYGRGGGFDGDGGYGGPPERSYGGRGGYRGGGYGGRGGYRGGRGGGYARW